MLNALLIFMMFPWWVSCCSCGDKQANTASLALLPLMHLAKAHFLLIHINFSGGITEACHDQSICFGLCEKESHLRWGFWSGFKQFTVFCV